ncbi:hypothetical protein HDV00_001615, partial [Rhizophlyctis rosea]
MTSAPLYQPRSRLLDTHGGIPLPHLHQLHSRLTSLPKISKHIFGPKIDMYRVVMALKSGVDSEVRWAVDLCVVLSAECGRGGGGGVDLRRCEGLVGGLCGVWEGGLRGGGFGCSGFEGGRRRVMYAEICERVMSEEEEVMPGLVRGSEEPEDDGGEGGRRRVCEERVRAVGTIMRNLTFGEGNGEVLVSDGRFRECFGLSVEFGGERGKGGPSMKMRLENLKDAVVMLSNFAAYMQFSSTLEAEWVFSVIECFLSAKSDAEAAFSDDRVEAGGEGRTKEGGDKTTLYAFPALEALAKLSLQDANWTYLDAWQDGGYERVIKNSVT